VSTLSDILPLVSIGSAFMGAVWWLASRHTHRDYVRREELEGLRALVATQYQAILRELSLLRQHLDK